MKKHLTLIFLFFVYCITSFAQNNILNKQWDAYWIAYERQPEHHYGVYHFRKTFSLDAKPSSFIVHVSADNRYKLYVNGQMVSLGPARADIFHWNYETVDIAPYLQNGNNVLASVVWNFGEQKPEAQISFQTGFILQGNSDKEKIVNTNNTWKCMVDSSYSPLQPQLVYAYYVAGPGEHINYSLHPENWQSYNYDDASWKAASQIVHGLPKGVFQSDLSWMLVPRPIPQMELKPQRLKSVRKTEGVNNIPSQFPSSKTSFTIPANTHATILLDQGYLTNAYPVLQFSKGKDAKITLGYAEALYVIELNKKDWKAQQQKGNRDSIDGKRFVGVKDELIADGKDNRIFSSLSWRTFRYMQLGVETKDEPLTIDDLYSIFTGYPFEMNAKFVADDPVLEKIMQVGWHTARSCAIETYMDCPYYEQLQYVGDTRIQALVSLFNSGDDRLMRQAISQIDHSRMAEGITLSRFPTANAQEIPPFSLWWIGMLHDYWMYRDDKNFVQQFLPGERQVLQFFSKYQQADGSLKNAPYWEFSDWSEGNGWRNGVPPIGEDGTSSVLDFQLLWAYQIAAQMEDSLGMKAYAQLYKEQANKLMQTITSKYWDDKKHLFSDTKEKKLFSQHANTLAILTNTVSGTSARQIAEKILKDSSLTQATIYFKYYVNQALAKAGLGDIYLNQLQIWKDNLANGMTTWAEMSDINRSRSDCHAWGASPNIEFFRIVLGIDSDAPGFNKINITPHLGYLKNVSGSMPHPKGTVEADYQTTSSGLKATIVLPKGTSGTLHYKDKSYDLKEGRNSIDLPSFK
ncbi:MAG: alpha-L-rhamnosidase-related protein [Ilyomonas sp.]